MPKTKKADTAQPAVVQQSAQPPVAGNKTAKERVAYHREQANEAFKADDFVKACGHVKAHGRAKDQLNWFMRKSPEERATYIAEKNGKGV